METEEEDWVAVSLAAEEDWVMVEEDWAAAGRAAAGRAVQRVAALGGPSR